MFLKVSRSRMIYFTLLVDKRIGKFQYAFFVSLNVSIYKIRFKLFEIMNIAKKNLKNDQLGIQKNWIRNLFGIYQPIFLYAIIKQNLKMMSVYGCLLWPLELNFLFRQQSRRTVRIDSEANEQRIEEIQNENQKNLAELEAKHKFDLNQLEIDLKEILNEIQKTQKDNKEVDIKFRFSANQHIKELSNLISKSGLGFLNELKNIQNQACLFLTSAQLTQDDNRLTDHFRSDFDSKNSFVFSRELQPNFLISLSIMCVFEKFESRTKILIRYID
ncbi:hypothetical protein BpHYR1_020606 [Brachionus plicatilis]|uniref:Uncharacterized protein n=1 Tax=Brachionus plicatilis TaxID=10195 RepID=A0A3M7PQJ5_BRAPC|nr:hypothetical protein BpHYR1_020606 [Brachionus plicatilis]